MIELSNRKVGLIGNGSWATAIAKMLNKNLETFNWWVKDEYVKGYLERNRHNPNYLTDVEFKSEKLKISTDINEVVMNSDIIFLVVPSIYVVDCLSKLTVPLTDKFVVTSIKGIIPDHYQLVGQYLFDKFDVKEEQLGIVSGPCHAEEVALERLSYLTIAAQDENKAQIVADCLACDFIKTKLSNDIYGTEFGAVLKNIYAIAAGIAHGLGYGDNFQAVLMSNAIREMNYILKTTSPMKRKINESAYLGDLLVTGYSFFSRNRMFGNMIGKGYTVKSAILEMNMVAEGYYATKGVAIMNEQYQIKAPIINAVHKILYEDKNAKKTFEKLSKKLD
ncbi:NAD(P)H-dependent glycerol-3-phosphate dehydrogenase [Empedobacter sedimenti]|uniref:NAD(P)H-dependent glycerol-3-phosphate dehydrogenase n=1 Tax=Empedobacter sedimenti TaxID=3042610 RepID=UPI0024A77616|nr:NAD(P)H-dependent glycerol-3-phosphate dehydrogenase [Empedobacter sedimenti]